MTFAEDRIFHFAEKNALFVLPHSSVSYNIKTKNGQKKHTYINREIFRERPVPGNTEEVPCLALIGIIYFMGREICRGKRIHFPVIPTT